MTTPGTPQAPRLNVTGHARLEVPPETATLVLTATARGGDRDTTLAHLTSRNHAVLALLRTYPDAIERTASDNLVLTPELTRHGRGERVRAYHGQVRTTTVVTDFAVLGELTTELGGLELTTVSGPFWALRPDSPVHRTVRQQAVRDAVQRAREYADALGAELTALLEVSDSDLAGGPPRPAAAPAGGAFRSRGDASDEPAPLDLEPRQQSVTARVQAHFLITPPDLGGDPGAAPDPAPGA